MFEVAALVLLIVLLPQLHLSPWWAVAAAVFVIPGMYATWAGAPFVPTPKKTLKRMIELSAIKPGETVFDLGCGDGRLVFAAAARGANAVGYEYSIPTYMLAKLRSLFHRRSSIKFANFWTIDFRSADVIFCYLLTDTMQTFRTKIWPQLKPGCRVVSHSFRMKDVEPLVEEPDIIMYRK